MVITIRCQFSKVSQEFTLAVEREVEELTSTMHFQIRMLNFVLFLTCSMRIIKITHKFSLSDNDT